MEPSEVIRGALKILGDDGENWQQLTPQGPRLNHSTACISNALFQAGDSYGEKPAHRLVADEIGLPHRGSLILWNDDPHTTFLDVRLVLKRALARAEEDES